MYPWFVRYTENIQRDAPSQSHIYLRVANESLHRDSTIEEIVKWHKETRPVSDQLLKDILPVVTPANSRRPDDSSISTGTTGSSSNSSLYPFEGNANDRYDALLNSSTITPDRHLTVLTQCTPVNQPLPLTTSDLNLWGSGYSTRQSKDRVGQSNSNATEIAQLLARVAELQALEQVPSSNLMQSRSSTPRPSYPPVDLWGPTSTNNPMLRSKIASHNSRGLVVPRNAKLQDGCRSVSLLTKELKIDMVTEKSYATLTKTV